MRSFNAFDNSPNPGFTAHRVMKRLDALRQHTSTWKLRTRVLALTAVGLLLGAAITIGAMLLNSDDQPTVVDAETSQEQQAADSAGGPSTDPGAPGDGDGVAPVGAPGGPAPVFAPQGAASSTETAGQPPASSIESPASANTPLPPPTAIPTTVAPPPVPTACPGLVCVEVPAPTVEVPELCPPVCVDPPLPTVETGAPLPLPTVELPDVCPPVCVDLPIPTIVVPLPTIPLPDVCPPVCLP